MNQTTNISELYQKNIIPVNVFDFCISKGINTLEDLIRFHDKCGSFCSYDSRRLPVKELTYLYSRAKRIQEYDSNSGNELEDFNLPISARDIENVVKVSTSLDEMFAIGRISQRTINCCSSYRLYIISDLIEYKLTNKDFKSIRNCGKKSIQEIEDLIKSYEAASVTYDQSSFEFKYQTGLGIAEKLSDRFVSHLQKVMSIQFSLLPDNVSRYMISTYPSAEIYFAKMYAYRSQILNSVPELSSSENIILRSAYLTITKKIITWLTEYLFIRGRNVECFVEINTNIEEKIERLNIFDQYNALTEIQKSYINNKYLAFCEEYLSVRAKKIQEQYLPTIDTVPVHFSDNKEDFIKLFSKNKHSASVEELYRGIKEFKSQYDIYITHNDDYILSIKGTNAFPFLLSFQRKFVNEYSKSANHLPLFFILSQYLKSSDQRNDQIYSLYYGISDGKVWSRDEIAPKFNVTNERVRQICASTRRPPVCKGAVYLHSDWQTYDIFNEKVISENSVIYQIISEEERLKFDFYGFAGIIRLFGRHEIVDVLGTPYLIDLDICDQVNISQFIKAVNKLISKKRSEDYLVHISEYVPEWNQLTLAEKANIIISTSILLKESLGLKIENNGVLRIAKNTIDKEQEIIEILSTEHRPMHVNEIAVLLTQKYPVEKWTIEKVKHCIQKSEDISPIGKSSTYGLKNWSHIFFGSIRDLLLEILSESEEPLHIDDILEKVNVTYPNTNKKSVASTMANDTFDRFEVFENGYYGLSDREYRDIYIKIPDEQRFPFERRIEMFRDFVDTYHRFPMSNSGSLESSLKRWHYNVINDIVQITPEQRQIFDSMIDEYSKLKYPQSALEVSFWENCESVKDIIQNKHRLPKTSEEPDLYFWLRHYVNKYLIYDDQRKIYFEDLLRYIHSYGFSIQ